MCLGKDDKLEKIGVDINGMKSLLEISRKNGTEGQWILLAVEWMEKANEEIIRLKKQYEEKDEV